MHFTGDTGRTSRKWNLSHTLLPLFLLLLLGQSGLTQEATPADDQMPTYTSLQKLRSDITQATLTNGLTVIVQENHVAPVATVRCYVKNTGSAFESKYLGAGLSHVLEHVVAGGTTKNRTEDEIEAIIDTFGGATNAFTSTNMTAYYIDCPATNAMAAIELIADSMQNIVFEPSEFARELKVVRRELADGEVNRQRVIWKLLSQCVYTEHPARHPIIGYLDVLNSMTNDSIIDFYRERYVPNNQIFVVAGDIDTQAVLDKIAQQWAGTPRGLETAIAMPEEPEQLGPREAIHEMDGSTYDVALAWPTVRLSHPDLFALDVAAYILAEGDSSRMVRRLKYDEQVVLSVSSASATPYYVNGWFGVFAVATPDTWQAAERGILEETYRLCDELVTEEELNKAKKQKAAELIFGQQTVQQAADSMGRNFISAADPLFDEQYVAGIQQVTAEQIRDVARRYFRPDHLNRVIIAPPGGSPQETGEEGKGAEGEILVRQLSNGVRVLIKQHSHLPMVNMRAYVLGSALVDTPETAGRSALVGSMMDKGTATQSAEQIAEYFDSIGGSMSMSAGRNTLFGSVTVLKEDFTKAAALFADCFNRPTFPEEEFQKAKQLTLGAIARRGDDPQQEVLELFYDNLPADSPYHIIQGGKKETVERFTRDDMVAYHNRYFVPENMLVTVFGDIDPDAAMELVQQQFEGLKPSNSFDPPTFDRPNKIEANVVRHKQIGKPTGMVMLGYEAAGILNEKDYAALTLLDAIMSGYGYPGGWLHNELRGEGLVYYVHAFVIAGPSPGYFAILAQTNPDALDEVVQRIRNNVERAKSGDISEEEFLKAQQMVIALHAQENTTIGSQAQQAALDAMYGLGFDYDRGFDQRIKAVTLEDVIRAARKYLTKSVLVTSSPEAR